MIRIQQQSGDDISVNDVTEDALSALKYLTLRFPLFR